MSAERVILADIAKEAMVHKTTVSLALRNSPRLPPETRERICAIANRLGYRPDPVWSQIAERQAGRKRKPSGTVLGLIVHDPPPAFTGAVPFYRNWLETARPVADHLGYRLDLFETGIDVSPKQLNRTLLARNVRGLIILQTMRSPAPELDWKKFSIVCCGQGVSPLPFHTVKPDVFSAVELAAEKAIERGYRKIGFAVLSHNPAIEDDSLRFGAACASQNRHRNLLKKIPILSSNVADQAAFMRWFEKHRPDAVIGFSAYPFCWLRDAGIRIPQDTAYVDLIVSDDAQCPMSGPHEPAERLLSASLNMLALQIRQNQYGPPEFIKTVLISPVWQERQTLPAIHAAD